MLSVGIDPGVDGAVAVLGDKVQAVTVMPVIEGEGGGTKRTVDIPALRQWLMHQCELEQPRDPQVIICDCAWLRMVIKLVALERVSARPGQGVTSMFNFGKTTGMLMGLLQTVGISTLNPTPQAWKKAILEGTAKDKAAAIQYVRQRYPDLSLLPTPKCRVYHDGMADAVCLAEYAKRKAQ